MRDRALRSWREYDAADVVVVPNAVSVTGSSLSVLMRWSRRMCRSSRQRVQGRREYLGGGVILPMGYAPLPSRTSVSGVGHHARPIEKATIRSDPDANNANFDMIASGTWSWDSTETREDMTSSKLERKRFQQIDVKKLVFASFASCDLL